MDKVTVCGINTADLPKLSKKESDELLKRIADKDEAARKAFIIGNMRLVLAVIKRFGGKKENYDDLFQSGCIGLIKAVDYFDNTLGVKFSTYAVPMIIGEVKRCLKGRNSIRVSRSVRDTAYRVLQTREMLERSGKQATMESVAKEMKVDLSEVVYALDAISDTVSLYEPVYCKNGDELLLMDQIKDESNTAEKWTETVALADAMKGLPERERKIVYLRYFEGKTQTEISEEVGISQAQVSRLEKNALKEMKSGILA